MDDNQDTTIKTEKGIRNRNIVDEMKTSYINYAMSVIVARALPSVRDGLKPVQRRILYAMSSLGYLPNKGYKKCARTVGEVMGKYHPHGDQSIYDALVRLAQDFNMRYQLIDGQGNFGSIDGDSAAAMRYTEARLHKHSLQILEDINKKTVDFVENYDGTTNEPVILPSRLPTLLLNGADGIAVGMATKIPPHNLGELLDGIDLLISKGNKSKENDIKIDYSKEIQNQESLKSLPKNRFPDFTTEVELSKLMKIIPGPDFPTGGQIFDTKEIETAYATGRGRILMRGVANIEEITNGKFQIIITELPFQVNKARLVAKIADLVKIKKIEGISDLRDESSRLGMRVVIDLKRDGKPKTVLNKLFKYTELQKAFNANILALVENEPKVLNLTQILEYFIKHRQEIIIRRSEFELASAKEREHILEGLIIALDNLDEVIKTIRQSKDSETAKQNLMKKFKLSEIQSLAILDMQLRRLAAMERKKIEDEYKEIKKKIKSLITLLSSPEEILKTISSELLLIKEKYADKRRTKVFKGKVGEINEEDLEVKEEVFITISKQGYIKRMKQGVYKSQARGGVGKKGMTTKEDDHVKHVFSCNTHDEILFFTNTGRVFIEKVYNIPEFGRVAKGQALVNIINLNTNELVTSILTRNKEGKLLDEDTLQEGETKTENMGKSYKYLFMATRAGTIKKTKLSEFENIRTNGIIAIKLAKGDKLSWVRPTNGLNEIILITNQGRSIRFSEKDVRPTGRDTMGVRGIRFKTDNDEVISADVIRKDEDFMLIVSENGFGKITVLEQFPLQKRGGQGVYGSRVNKKTGILSAARIIDHPDAHLVMISMNGQVVKIHTKDLPLRNRQTSGVKLMRLKNNDKLSAIAIA